MGLKWNVPEGALSNKTQTLPEITPVQAIPSPPTAHHAHPTPIPFIDKISVIFELPTEQDAYETHIAIWGDGGAFKDKGTFVDVKAAKWGPFRAAKKIALPSIPDLKKCPLFQYGYEDHKAGKMRLEFVPVDLGWKGLVELHGVLLTIIDGGWNHVVQHGRITRLDVAVDFPDVLIDDFQFLPLQGATTKEWRVDGKLTGYTHGKPKGNHTAIYDRKVKRIAQNKPWKGKEGMRVERRIKAPPIEKLTELAKLPNPFSAMCLTSMPKAPPAESKTMLYVWDLFKQAVQVQGLTAALALLPQERRTLYRKHLADHKQPWWNPDAIWQGWPIMLDELKIGSPTAWL